MTIQQLIETNLFHIVWQGEDTSTVITKVFCCDLLSIAMGRAPEGGAWVTVMGNMNTLAVASLTETACIILAENAQLDASALQKAQEQGITVFQTEQAIFEAALQIHSALQA
ncbi:MAG: DRTGG domain-containing protein [Faecalibacterium sp.]